MAEEGQEQQGQPVHAKPEDKALQAAQRSGLVAAGSMKERVLAVFGANRKGFEEGIRPGELTIPRVKLLQGLSPEVQEKPREFYAGMLVGSITKEPLSETFVPIRRMGNTWVRFNPRDDKHPAFLKDFKAGAVVWRSNDPKDPRVVEETKFGPSGEAPLAITFMNFLCFFEGFTLPFVLSFGKTSYKAGQDFLTMAYGFGGDMFSRRYKLASKQITNDKGTFYVLSVSPAGKSSQDEIEIGETLYDKFAGVDLKVHEEDEAEG